MKARHLIMLCPFWKNNDTTSVAKYRETSRFRGILNFKITVEPFGYYKYIQRPRTPNIEFTFQLNLKAMPAAEIDKRVRLSHFKAAFNSKIMGFLSFSSIFADSAVFASLIRTLLPSNNSRPTKTGQKKKLFEISSLSSEVSRKAYQ